MSHLPGQPVAGNAAFGARSPLRVLFVCSSNICRSPTAEAVLRRLLVEARLADAVQVESAGLHGFHAGERPDPRAIEAAQVRGYDLSPLRSRRITPDDLARFDLVVAMDDGHMEALERMASPADRCKLRRMLDYGTSRGLREVPDPFYGHPADFERVLDLLEDACAGLVKALGSQLTASGR